MKSQNNSSSLLDSYEEMRRNNESIYFDADEFDEIATQYEMRNMYREALEVVDRGLSMHPGNIDLGYRKVKYLILADAVEEAETLLETLPNNLSEYILLKAEILFIHGKKDEGVTMLYSLMSHDDFTADTCFEVIDLFMDFSYREDLESYIHEADKILKNSSEILREFAYICEDNQDYDKTIEIYNKLLDRNPYSLPDWLNLAKTYTLTRNFDKAIEACDFALTINENDPNALSFKGYCFFDNGQFDLAIEQFKEYMQYADDKSMAYELIAECYVKLGDNVSAHEFLKTAYEENVTNPNLCYQLAVNYAELDDNENAIKLLEETLQYEPTDADALAFMAEMQIKKGDNDNALKYILESLQYDALNSESQALAGDIYALLDIPQESVIHYEKALEYNPFDVKTTLKLILAYYTIGNHDKAAQLLKAIDEGTLQIEELEDISDANRLELEQTKSMLEQLREILRSSLDEKI